jgi:hypothetical protein
MMFEFIDGKINKPAELINPLLFRRRKAPGIYKQKTSAAMINAEVLVFQYSTI